MLPDKACENCSFYYCDAMGDYGSGPHEIGCRKYDNDPEGFKAPTGISDDPGELERFPFIGDEVPPCYSVEFWCTEFANDMDGSEERLNAAYERFRAFLDNNEPL